MRLTTELELSVQRCFYLIIQGRSAFVIFYCYHIQKKRNPASYLIIVFVSVLVELV